MRTLHIRNKHQIKTRQDKTNNTTHLSLKGLLPSSTRQCLTFPRLWTATVPHGFVSTCFLFFFLCLVLSSIIPINPTTTNSTLLYGRRDSTDKMRKPSPMIPKARSLFIWQRNHHARRRACNKFIFIANKQIKSGQATLYLFQNESNIRSKCECNKKQKAPC